jgi:uncharacterized protein YjbJ (UPF0337 family)
MERNEMSEQAIEGTMRNGLGAAEGAAGDLTGDADLQARGAADQAIGKTQQALDKVERAVSKTFGEPAAQKVRSQAEAAVNAAQDAYGRARTTATERVDRMLASDPYKALGIAAGVGLVLGLMLGQRGRRIIYLPKD